MIYICFILFKLSLSTIQVFPLLLLGFRRLVACLRLTILLMVVKETLLLLPNEDDIGIGILFGEYFIVFL